MTGFGTALMIEREKPKRAAARKAIRSSPDIVRNFIKQLIRPMVAIIGRIFMLYVGVGVSKAPSDEGAVSEAD